MSTACGQEKGEGRGRMVLCGHFFLLFKTKGDFFFSKLVKGPYVD